MSGCLRFVGVVGSLILTVWLTFTILGFIHSLNPGFYPFDFHPGDHLFSYCGSADAAKDCASHNYLGHIGIGFLVSLLIAVACTVGCGFGVKFALGASSKATEASIWKNSKFIAGLALGGSILAGIGFLVPWVTVTFAPPGGSIVLAGVRRDAFSLIINRSYIPSSPIPIVNSIVSVPVLQTAILTLFFFGLYSLVEFLPASQPKNQILTHLKHLAEWLQAPIPESILNFVRTLAHIVQSLIWIALLWFVFTYGKPVYQTTAGNYASIPYVTVTVSSGLGLMFIGLVLGGIGIYNKITANLRQLAIEEVKFGAQQLGQSLGFDGQTNTMLATTAGKLAQRTTVGIKIARFLEQLSLWVIRASLVILLILGSLAYAYLVLLPLLLRHLGLLQ